MELNFGVAGEVDAMISIANAAEASALESVWTGEDVVLPDFGSPIERPEYLSEQMLALFGRRTVSLRDGYFDNFAMPTSST